MLFDVFFDVNVYLMKYNGLIVYGWTAYWSQCYTMLMLVLVPL